VYELENRAVDPDGVLAAAMRAVRPWQGATVLDLGCGTGYHLPFFADEAARVIGVEPHAGLAAAARRRVRDRPNVVVRVGAAQALPLPELDRVVRRGGAIFIIDNDATRSTFGNWFRRSLPKYDPEAVERFWTQRGYAREPLMIRWSFQSRDDLAAVLRIEFPPDLADACLREHEGLEVDYAVNLWWRCL